MQDIKIPQVRDFSHFQHKRRCTEPDVEREIHSATRQESECLPGRHSLPSCPRLRFQLHLEPIGQPQLARQFVEIGALHETVFIDDQ